ncbi:MAG: hypothetical protein QM621_12320 [Aeromicrobium sp.]|uniref:hypothetical protein n=1 Tax=Aeromicrobium sp. TaxID=1871063 RepID=UPI0039E59C3F
MDLGSLFSTVDPKKLSQVVELVWDQKDNLAKSAAMAADLPDLIRSLAGGLEEAGKQAQLASAALVGKDGASGATTRLSGSARTVSGISEDMVKVVGLISSAVDQIEKVPLMGAPAKQLGKAVTLVEDTTGGLGSLADDLAAISDVLGQVGLALGKLGDALDRSGNDTKKSFAAI